MTTGGRLSDRARRALEGIVPGPRQLGSGGTEWGSPGGKSPLLGAMARCLPVGPDRCCPLRPTGGHRATGRNRSGNLGARRVPYVVAYRFGEPTALSPEVVAAPFASGRCCPTFVGKLLTSFAIKTYPLPSRFGTHMIRIGTSGGFHLAVQAPNS